VRSVFKLGTRMKWALTGGGYGLDLAELGDLGGVRDGGSV
jgi:hypothetical protein